jgi:hypothetical protein
MARVASTETVVTGRPENPDGPTPDPWAEVVTTATCREALLADLGRIRSQLEIGFGERIRDARALAGAVSNSDYGAVLDERERTMDSLGRLDRILERATVVDQAAWPWSADGPAIRARPARA